MTYLYHIPDYNYILYEIVFTIYKFIPVLGPAEDCILGYMTHLTMRSTSTYDILNSRTIP